MLPWPPSVNRYWRQFKGRMIISIDGRQYKKTVAAIVPRLDVGDKRMAVAVLAMPPDRRRRDLDNLLKATLDAFCEAAGFDDSQFDAITIKRGEIEKGGAIWVKVKEIKNG